MSNNQGVHGGLPDALQYAANLLERGHKPRDVPNGSQFIVHDKDSKVHVFEPTDPELTHVKQRVSVLDEPSFSLYFKKFRTPQSMIFADYKRNLVEGVFDYHAPPTPDAVPEPQSEKSIPVRQVGAVPDYCNHRIIYQIPFSEQWARWRSIDGKQLSQRDYAEFIEENFMDVSDPSPAEMLELVSNLEVKKDVTFASSLRLQTGDNQLTFNEKTENKGQGTLMLKPDFKITVPLFYGGTQFEVRVLQRFRIVDGKLTFTAKINRREFVEQIAFEKVLESIGKDAGTDIVRGSPGSGH